MDRRHGASMDDGMGMGHDGSTTAAAAASGSPMHMTMMAIFQTDMATSLYSAAWTPRNAGAYAGTCIFIIALAMLFRALLAFKGWQEERWLDGELNRRYVVVNGRESLSRQVSRDSMAKRMVLSENGVEEDVMVLKKKHNHVRPWRLSVDPLRALLDMVIAGVGYLLMIVVMTMNVGYFISVLGGTFLGSLLVGRYAVISEH